MTGECSNCKGMGWVCENHNDRPWDESMAGGCECGAGEPCKVCNPCDRENPPRPIAGTVEIWHRDKGWVH